MADSLIYGPVPSWRLGKSLGIDLLSTKGKTCSFNCIYCQLGRTACFLAERREFVSIARLSEELSRVKGTVADYATFSGMGEPTLASNLGEAIKLTRSVLGLSVAVLTNSSLLFRSDVRHELGLADMVVAKLDVPNEELFHQINCPVQSLTLSAILNALELFRGEYRGKLALQMMFIDANKSVAPEMAFLAERLSPDEIEINTPLRPCAVQPLSSEEIDSIRLVFSGVCRVITVYQAPRPRVTPLNIEETLRRRPEL